MDLMVNYGELWFDAYRSSVTGTSFYSNKNLTNITYDATKWDGGLGDNQCATWKVDKQKFKAHKQLSGHLASRTHKHKCSETRNFLCEVSVQPIETVYSKTFQCCPSGWIFYRGSCFIDSSIFTNSQNLNTSSIHNVCNQSSARLGILQNSDFNNQILKFAKKDLWIDARRDDAVENSFYTNNEFSSLKFNNSTWQGDLSDGEWCVTLNASTKKLTSRFCSLNFSIFCETVNYTSCQNGTEFRGSCFKSSNLTINNPQEQTCLQIITICNDSSARLAILYNNDSFPNSSNGFNNEVWIDAYRSENIQTTFFSKDQTNTLSYNSKEWEGTLASNELCAVWRSDTQKFKSSQCSSLFPILCETVQTVLSNNTKTIYNITEINCPTGWDLYRSSCFKQSVYSTTMTQNLTNDTIISYCNNQSARLAILFDTDFNADILTTLYLNESWIDAFRTNDTDMSFSSQNKENVNLFDSISWDGNLTIGENCATWNDNLKRFNSRMCNFSFPILCEIPY